MIDVNDAFVRLASVTRLAFESRSDASATTGWTGTGVGTVEVIAVDVHTLHFLERGTWTPGVGRPTAFTNVYRWTIANDRLCLAHLRFGADKPVQLFDLITVGPHAFASEFPHACRDDCYAARMIWDVDAIRLDWTITGPAKAERIEYVYR